MLWWFAAEYTSNIRQLMCRHALKGRSPYEVMMGETPDINAQVVLPHKEGDMIAVVIKRK